MNIINKKLYHSTKDKLVTVHTLDLQLSDAINFTSVVGMLLIPFVVAWLLKSTNDFSISNAAICLSSKVKERAFSMESQGQAFITPPSEPAHISPGVSSVLFINYMALKSMTNTRNNCLKHNPMKKIQIQGHPE